MEKLTIKNFGPIKDATIDLKKVNVFIGPQGSGKSTIAKLIAICREPSFLLDDPNQNHQFYKDYRIDDFFSKKSSITYESEIYSVEIKNEPLIHVINIKDPFKTTLFNIKGNYELGIEQSKDRKRTDWDYLMQSLAKTEDQMRGLRLLISNNPIYIPTERFLISTIADSSFSFSDLNALPKYLNTFGASFQIVRNNFISSFNSKILDISYKFEGGRDRIYFSESEFINLADSASGFQALLPVEIIISFLTEDGQPKTFIVEEPELNLYPETQKKFTSFLAAKKRPFDDLLLTTHSPYILSSLNTLLFAWKVANKFPERTEEISAITPKESWINPIEFSAYYVDNGTVESIIDDSTGMIGENLLDGISEELGGEFDALMSIYKRKKAA